MGLFSLYSYYKSETHLKLSASMAQLRKRPVKPETVHEIIKVSPTGLYYISRLKEPFITIAYDPTAGTGLLTDYPQALINRESSAKQIDAAFKKAIAWAKHNIKT